MEKLISYFKTLLNKDRKFHSYCEIVPFQPKEFLWISFSQSVGIIAIRHDFSVWDSFLNVFQFENHTKIFHVIIHRIGKFNIDQAQA